MAAKKPRSWSESRYCTTCSSDSTKKMVTSPAASKARMIQWSGGKEKSMAVTRLERWSLSSANVSEAAATVLSRATAAPSMPWSICASLSIPFSTSNSPSRTE
eukprot:1258859-Pleurochrysis_carterae.AAC.1